LAISITTFLQFPALLYCYNDMHLGAAIAIVIPAKGGLPATATVRIASLSFAK
jgi:hypothetical protein